MVLAQSNKNSSVFLLFPPIDLVQEDNKMQHCCNHWWLCFYLIGGTMQRENIHICDHLAWCGYDLVVSASTSLALSLM